jgi:hypothetical protein
MSIPSEPKRLCMTNLTHWIVSTRSSSFSICEKMLHGINPTPHTSTSMMCNNLSKVNFTNKCHWTSSKHGTSLWNQSHSALSLFFVQLITFFHYKFAMFASCSKWKHPWLGFAKSKGLAWTKRFYRKVEAYPKNKMFC